MPLGLDRLREDPHVQALLRGQRFALLAHPASVTKDHVHVGDVLAGLGLQPALIFGPEHGYGGEAQDMIGVSDARDARGIPVRSLYGDSMEALVPGGADLAGLDLVLVDLQDVGARYYTFVWTALLVLRACHARGVRVVVLDRPNPIGKDLVEGRLQNASFRSFVGLEPLPVRHALTLGEIVAHRASVEGMSDALTIIPARGPGPGPFVMPSPNMPSLDTALVYPGGCLLEGTNLSDGRGTTRPFEITGAPWLDGRRLSEALARTRLAGFVARPMTFRPTFHKHAGLTCGGVQIHVTDPRAFRPYSTYLALVALAHHHHPEDFRFRTERYEFVSDIPAFDLLTGDAEARTRILAGDDPAAVAWDLAAVGAPELDIVHDARVRGAERSFREA